MQTIAELLSQELSCKQEYIENVIRLLDEGNTIPFIARYRKEAHGADRCGQRPRHRKFRAESAAAAHAAAGEGRGDDGP